ncbi:HAD family hydrolase (plasmid) [Streptomyces sp. cg28]|uniref:HAD family hydrolase n=1 Tax=Streptomyces sp. cg28 TaxID=3403457 RepID=UPI003B222692
MRVTTPGATAAPPTPETTPPQAVAFDFFGTLGHWEPGTVGSPAQVLYDAAPDRARIDTVHLVDLVEGKNGTVQRDTPVTAAAYARWEEDSWRAAACYAHVPVTPALIEELRAVLDARRLELYEDVRPALRTLHEHHIPWVLCSNASPDVEGKLHTLLGPELRPRGCVVSWRVGARKPHPRMFTTVLDELAPLTAAKTLFIGDRYDCDIAGPRTHGFRTALLDRDGRAALRDTERAATTVWSDLRPLTELVRRHSTTPATS